MKSETANTFLNLEAGQYWKTEKNDLEIVKVGKLLAQYRVARDRKKRSVIKVEQVSVIQNYLNNNKGILA